MHTLMDAEQTEINRLRAQLQSRPTRDQVEAVMERNRRVEALYEAVLARNTVLKRRLDEATR